MFENIFAKGQFILQHINAPYRISKYSTDYFKKAKIDVLERPFDPPDLNPIENLFKFSSGEYIQVNTIYIYYWIKRSYLNTWNEITPNEYEALVNSIPNRLENV